MKREAGTITVAFLAWWFTAIGNEPSMAPRVIMRIGPFLNYGDCVDDANKLSGEEDGDGDIEEALDCLPEGKVGMTVIGKPALGLSIIMRLNSYPDKTDCNAESNYLRSKGFIKKALPCSGEEPPTPTPIDSQ